MFPPITATFGRPVAGSSTELLWSGSELARRAPISAAHGAHEQGLPPVRQRSRPRLDADGGDPLMLTCPEPGPRRPGLWKPYETLGRPRQQAMLEAAAMALKLITEGQIQARGKLGHLLTVGADFPVFDGQPPLVDHWQLAMAQISAVIESAQRNPAIARQLTAFFCIGRRSRPRRF